ncbi:MAG: alpha/beta hydrolase [Armatimonas sp.]
MLLNIALLLLSIYAIIVGLVFVFQRSLLYFPQVDRPEPWFATRSGLSFWPSETDYQGFAGPMPEGGPFHGTVVVFHGNGGRAIERTSYIDALTPRGFRVILVEYPGYGGRPGTPTETTLVESGRQAVRHALKESISPVYVWGESLGAGVAAEVVADPTLDVAGLVLITPWDSLPSVAQYTYPFLPARYMVKDRFDSIANLKGFQKPVAILLAENDEVIPKSRGQRLYDSLNTTKWHWVFPGVGHNTWPSGRKEPWWDEVVKFFSHTQV